MSSESPAPPPVVSPAEGAVIEFGGPETAPEPPRSRRSLAEIRRGLLADRRSVPLAALVGGVAVFASLVSEWQVTHLDTSPFGDGSRERPLPSGLEDLGALGAGYVAGLFVLTASVVLVLFGPAAGRRHIRLIGLATGGMLLALLAALVSSLGAASRAIGAVFTLDLDEEQIGFTYGRGLWCAFAGVLAVCLSLWLAGRHLPPDAPAATPTEPAASGEPEPPSGPVVWSWRRPGREGPAEDDQPDAPIDLTVSSASPFTLRDEDRDKPDNGDQKPG